jgi:hypothetical protein
MLFALHYISCCSQAWNPPCSQAPDVAQQEAMSDRLGEGAQYFLDEDATICFLKCRSAAEALNGTVGTSHRLLTVRPADTVGGDVSHAALMLSAVKSALSSCAFQPTCCAAGEHPAIQHFQWQCWPAAGAEHRRDVGVTP